MTKPYVNCDHFWTDRVQVRYYGGPKGSPTEHFRGKFWERMCLKCGLVEHEKK